MFVNVKRSRSHSHLLLLLWSSRMALFTHIISSEMSFCIRCVAAGRYPKICWHQCIATEPIFFCLFNVDADVVCSAKGRYSAFLAGHTKPFELMTFEIHSQQHVVAEYFRFSILANFNVSMFRLPNTLCGWSMMDSVETLREELPDIHETGYNHCIKVKINWWCEVRSRVHRTCDWKRTTMPSYRIMRIFLICRSSRVQSNGRCWLLAQCSFNHVQAQRFSDARNMQYVFANRFIHRYGLCEPRSRFSFAACLSPEPTNEIS